MTSDISLVAKWEAKDVTLKFYKYGEGLEKVLLEEYTVTVKFATDGYGG